MGNISSPVIEEHMLFHHYMHSALRTNRPLKCIGVYMNHLCVCVGHHADKLWDCSDVIHIQLPAKSRK